MPLSTDAAERFSVAQLAADRNPLARHYRRFRVEERVLLSGHSHQAWPDRGFEGQKQAWLDAAEWVDDKWQAAFAKADRVREGYRKLLDDPDGLYSMAESTHELLVRLLSSFDWNRRRRIVTTDREFYSLARQLRRLEEEGVEVVRVSADPPGSVGERLAAEVTDQTCAAFTSTVFFSSGRIAGDLSPVAEACRRHGAPLVLDTYHQLNVVPFSLRRRDLLDAFVVSAGYKYMQLGEGNAILRFPADCKLRPVATGWFAEFGALTAEQRGGDGVAYSASHDRFAGATYDPTAHYRAAEVLDFFEEEGLDARTLREVSQHQIALLARTFDEADLAPGMIDRDREAPLEEIGGFLLLRAQQAGEICAALKGRDVKTDFRGRLLRLGPAPYLSDSQIEDAVGILADIVRGL